jgi:hypothetical protein
MDGPDGNGGGGGGVKGVAGELATLSVKLAKEQVEAEKLMAPAKTAKQVAGKGA